MDVEEWRKHQEAMQKSSKERNMEEVARIIESEMSISVEDAVVKRKSGGLEDEGRRKKKRKLDKLVDWGEHPVGVEMEDIKKWLENKNEFGQDVRQVKKQQQKITEYTLGQGELLRMMVKGIVEDA